jgi:hypothetical protein
VHRLRAALHVPASIRQCQLSHVLLDS